MKKRYVYLSLIALPLFIMGKYPYLGHHLLSAGAPASSTGAPGEQNCTASGCHDDNNLNAGGALVELSFNNGNNNYEAGKTYPVKVKISDINKIRFGFQVLALKDADLLNAGSFAITDSIRTQVLKNDIDLKDREYATYTYNGTLAAQTGETEWTFNWIAPSTGTGDITLYLAGVSANNDGTDKGDFVYTTNVKLNPQAANVNHINGVKNIAEAYYDPIVKNIHLINRSNKMVQFELFDLTGKIVNRLSLQPGVQEFIPSESTTVYIIQMIDEEGRKIVSKIVSY